MKEIVTFGETMLRLAPNGYNRFFQDGQLQVTLGGGEANVAISLANYGMRAAFVVGLSSHAIGQGTVNTLRALGVGTSHIVREGDRVDIYYLKRGASRRGNVCIYDWAYSAVQQAKAEDFGWGSISEDTVWFHFTGITPASRGNLVEVCLQACQAAEAKGIKVSRDLNYRGKLWSRAQARAAMTGPCRYIDICIANKEDVKDISSIETVDSDIYGGRLNKSDYESVAQQLAGQFGLEEVTITLCTSLFTSGNSWVGILYDGMECYVSKKYHLHIMNQVGGGDSFAGELIYALLNGRSAQDTIEFTVAAFTLKHPIEGDFSRVACNEVEKLTSGDDSGRVQ